MSEERVPLEASRTQLAAGPEAVSEADPSTAVEATIQVRRRAGGSRVNAILRGEAPPLSREEAEASLGADPSDLQLVSAFAETHGLTVLEASLAKRAVRVSGTVAQMQAAFGVPLRSCKAGGRGHLCYHGVLTIPASLDGIIVGVLGLDQRPVARHGGSPAR